MSSIRERLSKVWRRSVDEGRSSTDDQSTVTNRDSFSSMGSGYSSVPTRSSYTSLALSDSIKGVTPRTLHKVASTTFQTFSDTIRSKARVFYVSPKKVDIQTIDNVGDQEDTPKNHQPRSSRWSASARSRKGHGNQDHQRELGRSSPTPMALVARSQEMTPTINVKIPSSYLIDSERSEDNSNLDSTGLPCQQAALKPCEPRQLWPSPISEALQQLSKIDLSAIDVPRSPMIDQPHTTSSDDFMYDSAMFDPVPPAPPASPEDQGPMGEGHHHSGEDQSEQKHVGTAPGSGSPTRLMPNKRRAMKRQHFCNSLFFKGGQARINFKGTDDTPPILVQDQREVIEAVLDTEALGMTTEPSAGVDMSEASSVRSKAFQRLTFYRTLSPEIGLNELVASSNSFIDNEAQDSGGYRFTPSLNEADVESVAQSPEVPAMGSRREWAQARADRDNRYFAIRSLDDDEKTEEDSEFGLELQRSPERKLLPDTTGATLALADMENREQIFDLNSPSTGMTDSHKKTPESPPKPILYAVETAIKNLSDLNLGLPEEPRSSLGKIGLDLGIGTHDRYAFQPPMTGHSATVEAALHRLIEGNEDWSNIPSCDTEEDEYVHEEPGGAANLSTISTPWQNDQGYKDRVGDEATPDDFSSLNRPDILEDSSMKDGEETYQFELSSLEAGEFWNRVCNMGESRSTEFIIPGNFETNCCIISESECTPIDESPIYLNPRPFPNLDEQLQGPVSAFSMASETSLMDSVDRLALYTPEDSDADSEALILPENAFSGFWSDLGQDLREYIVGRQAAERNAHNQGECDPKHSWHCFEDILKELAEIESTRHELDDQDRAFNAARLPCFNSTPSKAPQSFPLIQESDLKEIQSEPVCDEKEFDAASTLMVSHEHRAKGKAADKQPNPTDKPQNGREQTSPGKKGVWWASSVEYIDKPSSILTENGAENKQGAARAKTSTSNQDGKIAKKFSHRLQELTQMENDLDTVMEHRAW
jgi:hypothetical protein